MHLHGEVMDYNAFKSRLKLLVRRTAPDRVGHWTRYLVSADINLSEFVISLCYEYLNSEESKRREIESLMNDDDILWFIQTFIDGQAAAIEQPSDTEALVLGLLAIAIIGPNSDPRDVTFWLGDLYLAAVIASIHTRKELYEKVGNIAATKWGVAEQIKLFPERNEKAIQRAAGIKTSGKLLNHEGEYSGSGLTPMMLAAMSGNLPDLMDLIQNGKDINAVIDGASALAFAAFAGQEAAVELLLNSGARVNVKPHGMSLVEFANLGELKPRITERLKRAGAGP